MWCKTHLVFNHSPGAGRIWPPFDFDFWFLIYMILDNLNIMPGSRILPLHHSECCAVEDSGTLAPYFYHGTLKQQIKDLTSQTFHVINIVIWWGVGRLLWPWNLVNFPCFPVGLKTPSGEGEVYTCVCSGIHHSLSYYWEDTTLFVNHLKPELSTPGGTIL